MPDTGFEHDTPTKPGHESVDQLGRYELDDEFAMDVSAEEYALAILVEDFEDSNIADQDSLITKRVVLPMTDR